MWAVILLGLLVGATASAEQSAQYVWKQGKEYTYNVTGQSLTALHQVSNQWTGIAVNMTLKARLRSPNTLRVDIKNPIFSRVHSNLSGGWDDPIPAKILHWQPMRLSKKNSFELIYKEGEISHIAVPEKLPTWEVNILRAIASIFQLKIEEDIESVFKVHSEETVTGKCDAWYTATPMPKYLFQTRPDLSLPEFINKTEIVPIDMVKEINYTRCKNSPQYSFGLNEMPVKNSRGESVAHSSTSRVILLNNTDSYTIASTRTSERLVVSPYFAKPQKSMLGTRMIALLTNISSSSAPQPIQLVKKSLVYEFPKRAEEGETEQEDRRDESDQSEDQWESPRRSEEQSDESSDEWESRRRHRRSVSSDSEKLNMPKNPRNAQPFNLLQEDSSVDPIKWAIRLAEEIGESLWQPNFIPQSNSLGKFTLLADLLQTFNSSSLRKVALKLYNNIDEEPYSWVAYINAVAQAGTLQALENVEWMVKQGMLEGEEAAEVVASIPRATRSPTAKYVKQFFEFAKSDAVTRDTPLRRAAILAFTDICHLSQVNNATRKYRYPQNFLGELATDEELKDVEDVYIEYLRKKLNQAIADANSTEIQLYIRATGNIGHKKILETFGPYLRGDRDISSFQRLLIVTSLDRLVEAYPKEAQRILSQLYENLGESHEVRCVALMYLMVTRPDSAMLQHIAEFSNTDPSYQVRSAAQSTLQAAAKLHLEADAELARSAQAAVNRLAPVEFSAEYSMGQMKDFQVKDLSLSYRQFLKLIGSMDSSIHSTASLKVQKYHDVILRKDFEVNSMVSSVQQFIQVLSNVSSSERVRGRRFSESIPDILNIKRKLYEPLEGNFLINSLQSQKFIPFDNNTINEIVERMWKDVRSLRNGQSYNKTVLANAAKVVLGFPSVMGLPSFVIYSEPTLMQYRAYAKLHNVSSAGSLVELLKSHNISVKLEAVYSSQVESKIGFITPFQPKIHEASLVKSVQKYLPIQINATYSSWKNSSVITIQPLNKNKEYQILHVSEVPTTSIRPLVPKRGAEEDIQIVHVRKPTQWKRLYGKDSTGMAFRVNYKSEVEFADEKAAADHARRFDPLSLIYFPFYLANTHYHNISVYYDPKNSVAKEVTINTTYEVHPWLTPVERNNDNEQEESEEDDESEEDNESAHYDYPVHPKVRASYRSLELSYSKPQKKSPSYPNNAQKLWEAVLESKNIVKNGTTYVVRTNIVYNRGGEYNTTLIWTSSPISNRSSVIAYYASRNASSRRPYEARAWASAYIPQLPVMNMKKVRAANPNSTVYLVFSSKDGDSKMTEIKALLKAEQSQRLNKSYDENPVFKQCEKQMRLGDYIVPACRNATEQAGRLDYYNLTLQYENVSERLMNASYKAYSLIRYWLYPYLNETIDLNLDGPSPSGKLSSRLWFSTEWKALNVSLVAEGIRANFTNVRGWSPTQLMPLIPNPSHTVVSKVIKGVQRNQYSPLCSLDQRNITTIDNVTYPMPNITTDDSESHSVSGSTCWITALQTAYRPYWNNEFKFSDVSVLVKDINDTSRAVRIITGKYRIDLNSTNYIEVLHKGRFPLSLNTLTQVTDRKFVIVEAKKMPGGTVEVVSPSYGLKIQYDGKRLMISTNDTFKDNVRGLCGTNNGEHVQQFTSPRDCILRNTTLFAASYVLIEECNNLKAKHLWDEARTTKECYPVENNFTLSHQSANDEESSDSDSSDSSSSSSSSSSSESNESSSEEEENEKGGDDYEPYKPKNVTKAVERGDKYCFSSVKVPTCVQPLKPAKSEWKLLPYHCVSQTQSSKLWYDAVREMTNLNHDFSKKKKHVNLKTEVHKKCKHGAVV